MHGDAGVRGSKEVIFECSCYALSSMILTSSRGKQRYAHRKAPPTNNRAAPSCLYLFRVVVGSFMNFEFIIGSL